jgi:hypothetical protein
LWGWVVRDDWQLRSQYFKNWYILQILLENQNKKMFGRILPETIKRRSFNPELIFINSVHDCLLEDSSFLHILDRIAKRTELNKLLTVKIRKCLLDGRILSKSMYDENSNILQEFKQKKNQSDVLFYLAEHELYINEYRYYNWKKKIKKENMNA